MVVAALALAISTAPRCDLTLRLGKRVEHRLSQPTVDLIVENTGSGRCRLPAYPEVELIGPNYKPFGSIYMLPRQVTAARPLILRPHAKAIAVLWWLPWNPGNQRWTPAYIRVSAGEFPAAVPWRLGPVLRQDAATHPGTYIGPFRPTG